MTKHRYTQKKVSHKVKGKPSFWKSMTKQTKTQLKIVCAILLCTFVVSSIYVFLVAPFALRWKGIYSETTHPDGYSIRGIDVSRYQGDINWRKVRHSKIKNDPVSFVFIKATEGASLVDKKFKTNFHEAHENGIIRGAYHFFTPNVPVDLQVRNYINNVSLESGDLPPILDIEVIGNLTPEELRTQALTWLSLIEKEYGVLPILYTYRKFKDNYLNTPDFEKYPYWIAHYYVDSLSYKGSWKFWQYTDRGNIKGIKGDVDLNIFNGSMYNLQQLTIP